MSRAGSALLGDAWGCWRCLFRALLRWETSLLAAFAVALLAALGIGQYITGPVEILRFVGASMGLAHMEPSRYGDLYNIIVEIRLPRVASAVLVGAVLSSSGAAFQAVFRNPLVSPGLMGVLAGASFGAALAIVMNASWTGVQLSAFIMGLVAVAVGVGVAGMFDRSSIIMLVLGGMISSSLFAALLSIVKYLADPMNQLPSIVYWLMGNLAQSDLSQIGWLSLPMLLGVGMLIALGRGLDAMAMGDDEAKSLGVSVVWLRYGTIGVATMVSALTVSMAGMIGWVGLIIPHIARLGLGACNSRLIPASAILGATFLLVTDIFARTMASTEIPIGILTELLGVPAFLLVLGRTYRGWNEG